VTDEPDGRMAAILAVADALRGQRFVHEVLSEWRAKRHLAGREAALATELGLGTVRHLVTIEHILSTLAHIDRRRTAPRLRAILYTAVYQIVWLDRVPVFAAVDEAVALARRLVGGRAPGMTNAVLRRVAGAVRQRRVPWQRLDPTQVRVSWDQACRFGVAVLPEPKEGNEVAHFAAATGERLQRYAELVRRYGPEQAESVAWASQATPAVVLQRNALRVPCDEFARVLHDAFGSCIELAGDAAFLPPTVPVVETAVFRDGLVFIQDSTANAAARAVSAQRGERILDLCAAPGGKTLALALDMQDHGEVVACDTAPERLARVRENVERLRLTCVRPCLQNAQREQSPEGGPGAGASGSEKAFDAALVDVPCSNTGVIARRPEARLGLTPPKLRSLVSVQGQLLRQAAHCVRPGGRLVYSTCSIEPAENEEIVAEFLAENPAWRLDRQETILPAWGPRPSDWRDAGYFARLVRGLHGG
jgi:16S rRNA (cytosine967-C5)-methyltransferase